MKTVNWARRTCGLIATYNAGCRCGDCTRAARVKQAKYRSRVRAQRDALSVEGRTALSSASTT